MIVRSGFVLVGAAALALVATAAPTTVSARPAHRSTVGPADWRTYGHDSHHTFSTTTSLNPVNVHTLAPQWFFQTGDAVTANPVVVGGRVYVGSWDGWFYAIEKASGQLAWKYKVKRQPSVTPNPDGRNPQDGAANVTSDGGLITSSAWFEPASRRTGNRNLVLFGGGFTMYALDADDGSLVWQHDYTGKPEAPPDPANDDTRIFSSPVVVGDKVLFGVTSDGQKGRRGYVSAASLKDGSEVWRFETDVDAKTGAILNDGCGGVWSSPTIVESKHLLVLDVADCYFHDTPPYNETVFALHIESGKLAWLFRPGVRDDGCDYDFGATANLGKLADGTPFLGVGRKDGAYYALDPATGVQRWTTRVVFGGFAGGFIATTAFDGTRVYGATALGDFGRFEGAGQVFCTSDPQQLPNDQPVQEPSMHAFDATTGKVAWQGVASQSFGPTTVAGGMTFVGTGISKQIQIRDASNGVLLHVIPLPAANDGGVAVVGNSIYFGTGSSEQGSPAGVYGFSAVGG